MITQVCFHFVIIISLKCHRKTYHVKVKGKELYTFSRELTNKDTVDSFELPLNESRTNFLSIVIANTLYLGGFYQNHDSSHERAVKTFPSFVKNSYEELLHEYEVEYTFELKTYYDFCRTLKYYLH